MVANLVRGSAKKSVFRDSFSANNSLLNIELYLLLAKRIAEINSIKSKEMHVLSEITQAAHKLETQKSTLEDKLFSAWSDREISPKEMDDLLWKISDLSIAIKINKAGGLGSHSESQEQLKASLAVLNNEVDELDKLLHTILLVSMLIKH